VVGVLILTATANRITCFTISTADGIWYLNDDVLIGTLTAYAVAGFNLVGVGDFNGDSKPDYLLYNSSAQTVI
jgi:hypothetical protein